MARRRVQDVQVGWAADRAGFEAFFRLQYPRLVAIGRGITGSHEAGCDLAQETLLRCLRDWSNVAMLESPAGWARRVLTNLAIDEHRSNQRRRRTLPSAPGRDVVELGDPVVDGWWTAVRELPDRQRAAVVLHYVEDLAVTEIAAMLGVAEGTVKASLARARQTLGRTIPREV